MSFEILNLIQNLLASECNHCPIFVLGVRGVHFQI